MKENAPKWETDFKVCSPFFRRFEQLFTIESVDKSEWTKYLSLSITDPDDSNWLFTNIIIPQLEWAAAKVKFSSHFERFDHIRRLQTDYENIHFETSVQKYSHKFVNLCTELGYDLDDLPVRNHFMLRLPTHIHQRFLVQCFARKTTVAAFTHLSDIIDELIELDVLYATAGKPSSSTTPSSSDKKSSTQPLSCKFHPTSTTHTTKDCRLNPANNAQKSSSSGSSSPSKSSSTSAAPASPVKSSVQCHACKQFGHYANDPACPAKTKTATTTTTTTVTPSSSSRMPDRPLQVTTRSGQAPSNTSIRSVDTSSTPSSSDVNCHAIDRTLPMSVLAQTLPASFSHHPQ